jgi:hypothetical protein
MGASVSHRGALCKRSSRRKRADEGHTEEEEEAPATEGIGGGQPGASIIRAPREMGARDEGVAASSVRSHCPLVQLAHGSQTSAAWCRR